MSGQMKLTTDDTDCTDGLRRGLEEWSQRLFLPSMRFVVFAAKNSDSARQFVKKFSCKENTSSFGRLWDLFAVEGQPVVVSPSGSRTCDYDAIERLTKRGRDVAPVSLTGKWSTAFVGSAEGGGAIDQNQTLLAQAARGGARPPGEDVSRLGLTRAVFCVV